MHASKLMILPALLAGTLLFSSASIVSSEEFPPITESERQLDSVPFAPEAAAVVIERRGYFLMLDPERQQVSSRLSVRTRLKILKPQGKEYGEIRIPHSSRVRLGDFQGRTVLSDGTVIPLPKSAVFERRISKKNGFFETVVAFSSVEPGAILDYSYNLWFDSIFYLQPWVFQLDAPVLRSEITFEVPKSIGASTWLSQRVGKPLDTKDESGVVSTKMTISGTDFDALADEPYSVAPASLATRVLLVPTIYSGRRGNIALLSDWQSTCSFFKPSYDDFVTRASSARQWAKGAVESLPEADRKGSRKAVDRIFRFVRDEVANVEADWVGVEETNADRVFADRRGTSASKALLLQAMLHRIGVESKPVWTSDLRKEQGSLEVPIPTWFDRVILRIRLDGETIWADPSEPGLALGRLSRWLEGAPAVVVDFGAPEKINLPISPPEKSERSTRLELEVGADGRVTGRGELRMGGHWTFGRFGDDETAWKKELSANLSGFELAIGRVDRRVEEGEVIVEFTLSQEAARALGDEALLSLSSPIGPRKQPFTIAPSSRRTTVLVPFLFRDRLETTVRWPKEWRAESRPEAVSVNNEAGTFQTTVIDLEGGGGLTFRSELEVRSRELNGSQPYKRLRNLYEKLEKTDSARLSLVRP
jgi:hypothetical protein